MAVIIIYHKSIVNVVFNSNDNWCMGGNKWNSFGLNQLLPNPIELILHPINGMVEHVIWFGHHFAYLQKIDVIR